MYYEAKVKALICIMQKQVSHDAAHLITFFMVGGITILESHIAINA